MRLLDILDLPTFKEATVVAGKQGLTKNVQSVNLMDAPDIIDYLNDEQLLLTTAYSIKNNPNALTELVSQMAKQGCAGLGLKTKRFIEEIPAEVIEQANALDFPIIEIPLNYSLGDMLNEALGCILKERTHELNYALNIHREFTDIVVSGGGFSNIIESLATILNLPVILLNYRLDIMAYSHDIDKDVFFDIYWYIHEKIHHENLDTYKVLTLPREDQNNEFTEVSIYPINTTNQQKGYIIIFGTTLSNESSFTLAVEQAANVISFEFMKLHALEQHSRRLKNEFFADLVEGAIPNEDEIVNRGKAYQLNKSLQYICITCKMDDPSDLYQDSHPLQTEKEISLRRDRIYEFLESILTKKFENGIVFTKGDLFTTLLGFEFYNDDVEKNLLDTISDLQSDLYQAIDSSMSFGISNYTESITDIPTAFQEAVDALRAGYRENKKRFIKTYRIKELAEIFKTIPSQKLKEFYRSTLRELAYPKDKEKEDLVQTLSVFLNHNCQISETAKIMFIHRNTVIYRIKKCEEILGIELKGSDETLTLRIALFIRSFFNNKIERQLL
ncbi:PucR family transcriptional regulator [Alkalihalobacillus sp. MEB130]|uniref:PucR family transcriptional regulator n=1 Tax=Alkalihalobacillus sp. MEB130 TaxID=2976704 RepID=UPI0028DE486D|nr:PucR family transcriptional regulator [Alkalihalobacillus sp. MEB130]MDT8860884.1 PucR family transcriptional regulator [Alkalihalobacillus sp. MEB130]